MTTPSQPTPDKTDLATGLQVFEEMRSWRIWLFAIVFAAAIAGIITYVHPNVWNSRPWNLLIFIGLLIVAVVTSWIMAMIVTSFREIAATNKQITDSKAKLMEEASDTIQPAWDLALATLTQYWQRNTAQNRSIFVVSVLAIAAGFCVMLVGVWAALNSPASTNSIAAAGIVSLGGVLTQFIGATFLVMYKSTLQQMTRFNATLAAINSVGMAWYVLQAMDESTPDEKSLKNQTLARLAISIVGRQSNYGSTFRPAVDDATRAPHT
jgi:MFS family permease